MHYNAVLVVSDGSQARIGSLTANQEWFKVWRTIDGEVDAPKTALELEMLVRGVFEQRRFLDLSDTSSSSRTIRTPARCTRSSRATISSTRSMRRWRKRCAPAAMVETGEAGGGTYWAGKMHGGEPGDRRVGVVWHTQGSRQELLDGLLRRAHRRGIRRCRTRRWWC